MLWDYDARGGVAESAGAGLVDEVGFDKEGVWGEVWSRGVVEGEAVDEDGEG